MASFNLNIKLTPFKELALSLISDEFKQLLSKLKPAAKSLGLNEVRETVVKNKFHPTFADVIIIDEYCKTLDAGATLLQRLDISPISTTSILPMKNKISKILKKLKNGLRPGFKNLDQDDLHSLLTTSFQSNMPILSRVSPEISDAPTSIPPQKVHVFLILYFQYFF